MLKVDPTGVPSTSHYKAGRVFIAPNEFATHSFPAPHRLDISAGFLCRILFLESHMGSSRPEVAPPPDIYFHRPKHLVCRTTEFQYGLSPAIA